MIMPRDPHTNIGDSEHPGFVFINPSGTLANPSVKPEV